MEKKVLTIQDVRKAICGLHDNELSEYINSVSDEELLKAEFNDDLGMDSLDIIEVTLEIERLCTIYIPDSAYASFQKRGGTVQALIETCNEVV